MLDNLETLAPYSPPHLLYQLTRLLSAAVILTRSRRSFVGGDAAGRHIYQRGSANGKRVQCNMGAKNHGVIMPDANKEYTINQVGAVR